MTDCIPRKLQLVQLPEEFCLRTQDVRNPSDLILGHWTLMRGKAAKLKDRCKNMQTLSQFIASERVFWGWFFLIFGSVFFLGFFYAAIVSKLLPSSNNPILAAIQKDRYYCFLVPLTLPVLVVVLCFHWLSMKLFKHA